MEDEFKRHKEHEDEPQFNFDEELTKIVSESMIKAKSTAKNTNQVINPLQDLKKKELNKVLDNPTKKFKLITKSANKVVIREVDREKAYNPTEET